MFAFYKKVLPIVIKQATNPNEYYKINIPSKNQPILVSKEIFIIGGGQAAANATKVIKDTIIKEKPKGVKGDFILSSFLTSTMGISYKLKL